MSSRVTMCRFLHGYVACRTDWLPRNGQDRPVSTSDERQRRPSITGDEDRGQCRASPASRTIAWTRSPRCSTPKKRVPATVEFADVAGAAGAKRQRPGAARRRGVPQRRRAPPRRPHVSRPIRPSRRRQRRPGTRRPDDGRRTDSGGPGRRRAPARDGSNAISRKGTTRSCARRATSWRAVEPRWKKADRCARSCSPADDQKRLTGFQFLSAKPLLLVLNLDEEDLSEGRRRRAPGGSRIVRDRCRDAGGADLREDRARDRAARRRRCRRPSCRTSVCANPDSTASFAPATICSATSRSSPWARTSAGPGRFHATRRRFSPPGEIHSDISRGFIRAEVVRYEALIERGTLAACRDRGELRLEGKDTSSSTATSSTSAMRRMARRLHRYEGGVPERPDGARLRSAGAVRPRRRGSARSRAGARVERARLSRGARQRSLQVVSEGRDHAARRRLAAPRS